jgi:hypothetical protein
MKNNYAYLILLLLTTVIYGQTGQSGGIGYQAVIYKPNVQGFPGVPAASSPLANKMVCLQFTFVTDGQTEYKETQTVQTDAFGMVNLMIGDGEPDTNFGKFDDISWSDRNKSLVVELDQSGSCSNYEEISNQSFAAAPFAFNAITSNNVSGIVSLANGGTGADNDIDAIANLGAESILNMSQDILLDSGKNDMYPSVKAVETYINGFAIGQKVDKVDGERLVNAAEIVKLGDLSGVNTGDQDLSTYATQVALNLNVDALSVESARAIAAESNAITAAATDASTKANIAESNAATDASAKAATAESNAIAAAATDATTKANTAESNAITAAATDASAKGATAESNAIAAAVTDATTKANTAESNAITAAATDATTKANTAEANAITAAATDASAKANTAESNAATDASAKAATAESNAITAAATDATTKANTAESNAATDASAKANTAETNAITAAATDASTKANTAESNAATDASAKAATAESNAITAAATDASTKANIAESNAATDASAKAAISEANAIAAAATDATTKANTAESNAITAAATDASTKANTAESNATAVANSKADLASPAFTGTPTATTAAAATNTTQLATTEFVTTALGSVVSSNLYTADGSLDASRSITQNDNDLTFTTGNGKMVVDGNLKLNSSVFREFVVTTDDQYIFPSNVNTAVYKGTANGFWTMPNPSTSTGMEVKIYNITGFPIFFPAGTLSNRTNSLQVEGGTAAILFCDGNEWFLFRGAI